MNTAPKTAPASHKTSDVVRPNNSKNTRKFAIPDDIVARATKNLPQEQATLIKWLAKYCRHHNLGKTDIGTLLKKHNGGYYGYDSVYALLSGGRTRRGENIGPICEAISTLRDIETKREELTTSGFIETRLSRRVFDAFDKARIRQRIAFLFGDSQGGKTTMMEEYRRQNNHGQTVFIDMPAGGSKCKFLRRLAIIFGIPSQTGCIELERRIIDAFDHTMLLLIDNCHRSVRSKGGLSTMEFIQELKDRSGCGMGISFTYEGEDNLLKGSHAKALEQIWRRRGPIVRLPHIHPDDDLAKFAKSYGLPPAGKKKINIKLTSYDARGNLRETLHSQSPHQLQTQVNKTEGLGVWIMLLQNASDIARELNKPISWGAVIKAHCLDKAESEMIR